MTLTLLVWAALANIGLVACGGSTSNGDLTTSSSSGSASGGGGTKDGATSDGVVNPNGAPGGDTTSLPCGRLTCALPAETCCASQTSSTSFAFAYTKATSCSNLGGGDRVAALKCSSSTNCAAGFLCCASRSNDVVTSVCATSCDRGIQLCDPATGASGAGCAGTRKCTSDKVDDLGLPSTFGTCGGN